MADPRLARVKCGVNTKTWNMFFYVEARLTPSRPWRLVTDGKKWLRHRSERAAEAAAKRLHNRLNAKLQAAE